MATMKQVANKIGKDLNESYPNIQNLFDVLKRGFKDMENVSGGGGGGSEVDWTQLQVSGTKIAEIEIDGDKTNVYAPASQTIAVSQIQTTGTKIASISLDGVSTDLYAPNGGGGSAYTVITTSTANTSYASQLRELKTAYDNLTLEQKRRAVIVHDGSSVIFRVQNTTSGYFSAILTSALNVVYPVVMNLTNSKYVSAEIATTGTVTYSDSSSTTNSNTLTLAIM